MLIKFTPEQISRLWPDMAGGLITSLPPQMRDDIESVSNLLESLLNGKAECWISYDATEEGAKVHGAVITMFHVDDITRTRNMIIYAVYGIHTSQHKHWIEGYETLRKWAKHNNCKEIVAYSNVPQIVNIAKKLGADTSYSLIQLPIE